ncbi:MAG: phosphodiester glycosidase family protein [Candidatus Kapabacteria bacterium]|jgi:hypothetical protein|nr:phosphodiester glycosidase family protein [Candidatus Kapabacteria bacterium]
MKHFTTLRVIASLLCGSLLSADALEAAQNLLSASPAVWRLPKTASYSAIKTASKPASKASSKQTSSKQTSSKRTPSSKPASKQALSKTTSSKKRTTSRYRSYRSSKKYAYSAAKKRSSRKYYSRYHRRSKSKRYYASSRRSSSRKARVEAAPKPIKSFAETWHETLRDEELMPGVRYKHYIISTGSKHSIHVLEVDRTKPDVAVGLWKAQNASNGLESLPTMANRVDSAKTGTLQGMVNANFWRSYYNTPLGHAVVNGEVVEMGQYKSWSSCFFDRQNRMYIERFTMSATLRTRETSFPVETVNSRTNANGVVLYNRYGGKEVPVQPMVPVENIEMGTAGIKTSKTKNNSVNAASTLPTDEAPSQTQIQRTQDMQRRMADAERPLYKATLLYASPPMINEEVVCRVVEVDTGAVAMPQNGVVISFGRNIDESELPRPGDKVTLMFKTNVYSSVPFVHAVGGTPRLVRSGIPKHEATQEGTTGRNFISQKLPRTAIGTNSNGTMLYFVTTDPTDNEAGTTGMTLQELAEGMRQIGAYHALNLDGGASSSMVVRGDVNASIGSMRPISLALGIIQQDPGERFSTPKRKLITKPSAKPSSRPDQQQSQPQGAPRQEPSASGGNDAGAASGVPEFRPEDRK